MWDVVRKGKQQSLWIWPKSQVGWIAKQAFRECVLWISKQMITLNCDKIEPAMKKKDKERLIPG